MLATSKLEIGTYTTDAVKLFGSCMFYLVHPESKCLLEVTFYVTINNGSVLLSCATTLALGLIQPHTRLDYLPPRASLLLAVLIILRRPSPKSVFIFQRKSLKCLTTKIMFPSSLQMRDKFLPTRLKFLMVLDAFLDSHAIFTWIPVLH